jgi:hypothetical protein
VSLCGEEISKGKLDACNSEWMHVTVNLTSTFNPLMTLKETFLTGFSQHNKTFQLDIKAVQMAC